MTYSADQRVQQAEAEYLRRLNDEDSVTLLDDRFFKTEAKRLLTLEGEGQSYEATSVYFCDEFESDGFVCRGDYADDTIHTTEFGFEAIPAQAKLTVNFQDDRDPQQLQFFLGEPSEMHNSGYQSVEPLPLSNEAQLSIPYRPFEQILFARLTMPNLTLQKKYVWVIGASNESEASGCTS